MEKAIIITPTTLSNLDELKQNIESVKNQTEKCMHLIVIDGIDMHHKSDNLYELSKMIDENLMLTTVPFNTGGSGFYGHRIMAAFAHLHDYKYTLFLDQDNWYHECHVESLIEEIEMHNLVFSYSRRNIVDKDGTFICRDECESLGMIPSIGGYHLVDTSSYCFKTDFLTKVSQLWHKGWGADRDFFNRMLQIKNIIGRFDSTNRYTLNYRLGGNDGSVKANFFIEGNKQYAK